MQSSYAKEKLKIWDDEIKLIIQQRPQTTRLNRSVEEPLPKEKSEKGNKKSWEQFISHLESDIYKIKPNTFKLLKHMNMDIIGSANISVGPSKEIFLRYYKELQTNNSH